MPQPSPVIHGLFPAPPPVLPRLPRSRQRYAVTAAVSGPVNAARWAAVATAHVVRAGLPPLPRWGARQRPGHGGSAPICIKLSRLALLLHRPRRRLFPSRTGDVQQLLASLSFPFLFAQQGLNGLPEVRI
jgi:hypothetical protein